MANDIQQVFARHAMCLDVEVKDVTSLAALLGMDPDDTVIFPASATDADYLALKTKVLAKVSCVGVALLQPPTAASACKNLWRKMGVPAEHLPETNFAKKALVHTVYAIFFDKDNSKISDNDMNKLLRGEIEGSAVTPHRPIGDYQTRVQNILAIGQPDESTLALAAPAAPAVDTNEVGRGRLLEAEDPRATINENNADSKAFESFKDTKIRELIQDLAAGVDPMVNVYATLLKNQGIMTLEQLAEIPTTRELDARAWRARAADAQRLFRGIKMAKSERTHSRHRMDMKNMDSWIRNARQDFPRFVKDLMQTIKVEDVVEQLERSEAAGRPYKYFNSSTMTGTIQMLERNVFEWSNNPFGEAEQNDVRMCLKALEVYKGAAIAFLKKSGGEVHP